MIPQDFVRKWRGNQSTEKQVYQQHFLDLCALAEHKTPQELDRHNKFFMFEAPARKPDGSYGYADVWLKGKFAIEYKSADGNLDKAYKQLLDYRESLYNPPLLITSNIETLEVHTNFNNSPPTTVKITLDDLLTPEGLQAIRSIFQHPEYFRHDQVAVRVTEAAAARFAKLAEHLRKWGNEPQDIAHYLIRILFALFAEDIGLLQEELLTNMIAEGVDRPKVFNQQLQNLFNVMADGGLFGPYLIPYFDGGLFDIASVLDIDSAAIAELDSVAKLDWSSVEPAILGTLFTRGLDPSQRSKLGAQYTSKEDILLVVEPVLIAPLRKEWEEIKARVLTLARARANATTGREATKAKNEIERLINGFLNKLATIRILDPACGSGNFLYMALLLLLDLWLEVREFAGEMGMQVPLALEGFAPHPSQLYGIEINEYAHELASTTVWIGYLQWLHRHGFGIPTDPILKPLHNIRKMDAILAYNSEGDPTEPEWPEADVIVGNPPFLGGKRLRRKLSDEYVNALFQLYDMAVPREADLVCYWFERSRQMVASGKVRRVGLLATNSIRGGPNRRVLDRIKASGDFFMAWSDRDWILEGAAVNVSMIGFDDGSDTTRTLNGQSVTTINADLTSSENVVAAASLRENHGLSFMGVTPAGPFDVPQATADGWLKAENSDRSRSNAQVVRQYFNGLDITRRVRNVWIVDFGVDMPLEEAKLYHLPYTHVEDKVKPIREHNNRPAYREYWWIHAESRPAMRKALEPLPRYIGTSMVAKHLTFAWIDREVLPANLVIVVARDDDYFFGALHSKPHRLWALRQGTSLEDRPRYTPTSTFETYPFPWPPGKEPKDDPRVQAIAKAAAELVRQRDDWLNPHGLGEQDLQKRTLTNLYNERPDWLAAAHEKLDAAVFDAYGWPYNLSDEDILARLLALNLQRAQSETQHLASSTKEM